MRVACRTLYPRPNRFSRKPERCYFPLSCGLGRGKTLRTLRVAASGMGALHDRGLGGRWSIAVQRHQHLLVGASPGCHTQMSEPVRTKERGPGGSHGSARTREPRQTLRPSPIRVMPRRSAASAFQFLGLSRDMESEVGPGVGFQGGYLIFCVTEHQ
jgi:hypothetical protein